MGAVAFPAVAIFDSSATGRSILTAADVAAVLAILGISGGGGGGSTWFIAAGAPSDAVGVNGDAYLNVTNGDVYSKAAGTWGAVAGNIKGPTGATGATGATGDTGPAGATGAAGADGADGASAYEVAVAEGFVGDEAAWLASLVGATGATGVQGPLGDPGATGAQGPQGDAGATGATGAAGADGNTIHSGSGAPSSGLGVDGDFYIDTAASTIYGPKTAGAWGSSTSIIGPTGATGATGSTGATGAAGADGADGADGQGVPVGGSAGQVLAKIDGTDYNTQWAFAAPQLTAMKTADYTAAAGDWARFDLSAAGADVTCTLPATPSVGDRVVVTLATKHATHKLVVARNGSNVNGVTTMTDFDMTTDGGTCVFTYVGGNAGWIGAVAV